MKNTSLFFSLLIILCLTIPYNASAAVAKKSSAGTGLKVESEASYKARDAMKMVRSFSKDAFKRDRATLPSSVDLAKDFPRVGNQGTQASCVAWALAYAVKTAHEHREHGWDLNKANHLFSPAYVYNQVNNGTDGGTTIDTAIKLMERGGTVPLAVMPYDDLDYVTQPTSEQKELGQSFRIGEYRRVAEKNVDELKRIIASGEPVVMAIEIYPTFMGERIKKTNGMYSSIAGDLITKHAVVLVGYDDAKKAFKLMNSWGSDWGDGGYGWLAYDFLPRVAVRAYVVYDTPTPKKIAIAAPIEPFYLVPEERGIKVGDAWLRLGDTMSKAKKLLGTPIAESPISLMFDDDKGRTVIMGEPGSHRVAQILFLHGMKAKSAGKTNRGLEIGATKSGGHRIYGKPDLTLGSMDTYFYEAVAEDFGGLDWTKHVTMLVDYDDKDEVRSIKLLKTDKGAMTGSYLTKMDTSEKKRTAGGTQIAAASGEITFSIPRGFDEPKKSVWKDVGYGYFMRSKDGGTTLTVKVFDMKGKDADETMEKFSKKDLSAMPSMMKVGKPEKKDWGGIDWKAYTITSDFGGPSIRAYAVQGDRVFSIVTTAPDAAWYDGPEAKNFFESIAIK